MNRKINVFEFVKQKSKVYFDIDKEGALKLIDELEKQNLKNHFFMNVILRILRS